MPGDLIRGGRLRRPNGRETFNPGSIRRPRAVPGCLPPGPHDRFRARPDRRTHLPRPGLTSAQDELKTDSVYQDGAPADLTFMYDSTIFIGPVCYARPE